MRGDPSTSQQHEGEILPSVQADHSEDRVAEKLRGFRPLGILSFIAILAGNFIVLPLSAILVLIWARWSRTPFSRLGFSCPRSWVGTIALGLVFGAAFKLTMKSIVMPLVGADPINHAFHYLAGNTAALPGAFYLMIVGAGFGEETLFRGYFFERLGKLFGDALWAKPLTVILTASVFGMAHYANQGLAGVEQATIVGLVFGTIFAVTGRIWMLMVAHAAFDLTALYIIYYDLEFRVAHLFFK